MSFVALHHTRYDEPCHGEQSLDVGINHGVPIFRVSHIFFFQSECQSRIVDQHIDLLPFLRHSAYSILRCLGVSDIKLQGKNLSPILFQFVTQNLKFLSIPSCEDKIIASLSKLAGTSLANSTGGTRDHHNFLHISFI